MYLYRLHTAVGCPVTGFVKAHKRNIYSKNTGKKISVLHKTKIPFED